MFCPYCGKKIDDDSVFCIYCGKMVNNSSSAEVRETSQPTQIQESQNLRDPKTNKPLPSGVSKNKKLKKSLLVLLSLLAIYIIGCVFLELLGNSKTDNDAQTSTSTVNVEPQSPIPSQEDQQIEQESITQNEPIEEDVIDEEELEKELGIITYVGFIDDKYPITVKLQRGDTGVYGHYYYDKNGPDRTLSLDGDLIDENESPIIPIVIKEFNNNNEHTGTFILNETEISRILSGTFRVEKTGKEMPFRIESNNFE